MDLNKLWKILKEIGIPDHLTCVLRNLYAGQEATVRTGHGTMDWLKIGEGVYQGCIFSPCLFNFYEEYITQNISLDESQAGIKTAGRNIKKPQISRWCYSNGRKQRGTKSLLMRVKEESEKASINLNIQKTNIMASSPITSWQIDGEKVEIVQTLFSWASKIIMDSDCSHEIKRC